ncbi:MAG: hypothetical protein WCV80_00030 [Candidatus Paceibacterota bacterium]|jgi:hypothetical protein
MKNKSPRTSTVVIGFVFLFSSFFLVDSFKVLGASLTDMHFLSGAGIEVLSDTSSQLDIVTTSTTGGAISIRVRGAASGSGLFINTSNYVGVGTTTPATALHVIGTVTATAFSGPMTGALSAANITSDVFGRLQGNGNFAFPAGLNIGTSTATGAPTNGLFVGGNVGIGTISPGYKLQVTGGVAQFDGGINLPTSATNTLGTVVKRVHGNWGANNMVGGVSDGYWIQVAQFTLNGDYQAMRMNVIGGGRTSGGVAEGNPFEFYVHARNGVGALESANSYFHEKTSAAPSVKNVSLVHRSGTGSANNIFEVWIQFGTSWQDSFPVEVTWWGTGTMNSVVTTPQAQAAAVTAGFLTEYLPNYYEFAKGRLGIGTTVFNPGYALEIQAGAGTAAYFQTTADSQFTLKSTDTWTGMTFDDSGAINDNIWYNGANGTFAIGGGGANVSGKKLHIDGGTSIGANYDATAAITNGLAIEGNVGVGTSTPSSKLHVSGGDVRLDAGYWLYGNNTAASVQPLIRSRGTGYAGYYGVQIGQVADHIALFIDPSTIAGGNFNGGVNEIFLPNNVRFLQANSGGTDWIYNAGSGSLVLNDGKVGIGTLAPSSKLDIRDAGTVIPALGTVGSGLNVLRTDGAAGVSIGYENTNGDTYIQSQRTDSAVAYDLLLQPRGGNVGVGTTTPTYPLDVVGNIRSSTGTYLTNNISGAVFNTGTRAMVTFGLSTIGNALITNDIDGAKYAQTTGAYDLTWFKHKADDGTWNQSFVIEGDAANNLPQGYSFYTGTTKKVGIAANGDLSVTGSSTISGNLGVSGTVTATAFSGPMTGALSAANVTSDVFGRLQGNGNFAFPAGLNIGTSTATGAPTNGLSVIGDIRAGIGARVGFRYSAGDSNMYNYITADGPGPLILAGGLWTSNATTEAIRLQTQNLTAAVSILNNGNVGVGTTGPTAKMHVYGLLRVGGAVGDQTGIIALGNDTSASTYGDNGMFRGGIGTKGSGNFTNLSSYEGLVFNVQATEFGSQATRMVIRDSGYVGIGTTGPAMNLHVVKPVYSNTLPVARFDNGTITPVPSGYDTAIFAQPDVTAIRLIETNSGAVGTQQELSMGVGDADAVIRSSDTVTNGLSIMTNAAPGSAAYNEGVGTLGIKILNSGNVGIGTATPGAILHVAGGSIATPTLRGSYGTMLNSRDEWLRINDDDSGTVDYHTNGVYVDGPGMGMQGGLHVGGSTIPAAGTVTATQFVGGGAGITGVTAVANGGTTDFVTGTYTGSGGLQPPSYIPSGKVRFNMMTGVPGTSGGYQDWILMDTYTGGDVPFVTGIGVNKTSGTPVGYLISGGKGGATWTSTQIITAGNIGSQTVSNSDMTDGYHLNQVVTTAGNPTFADVYANPGWFRNYARTGIYNQTYGTHFYTSDANLWRMSSGQGLLFNATASFDSAVAGYVYHDTTGFGLLNNQGNWMLYSAANTQTVTFPGSVYTAGGVTLNNTSPTTYYQDSDNRSAMIHVNSNLFYVLRGDGTGSTGWAQYNGQWPLIIDLENNNMTVGGNLTVNGGALTVNKVNANEVDPPYTIDGKKYATYMAGMTGLKEETSGVIQLEFENNKSKIASAILDFKNAKENSDLWLFNKTTNLSVKGLDNITILLTPNFDGKTWYEKKDGIITIYAAPDSKFKIENSKLEISYRLTAPRFDAGKKDGNRRPEFDEVGNPTPEGINLDKLLK